MPEYYGLDDPPDVVLLKRAKKEKNLSDVKVWKEGGYWLVSGFDGRGKLRLYHPLGKKKWEKLDVEVIK